jgi:ferredoxin
MALTLMTDRSRCSGHARCNALAPVLFTIDVRGYIDLPAELRVPGHLETAARDGAESCPEGVFRLVSDELVGEEDRGQG